MKRDVPSVVADVLRVGMRLHGEVEYARKTSEPYDWNAIQLHAENLEILARELTTMAGEDTDG